MREVKFMKLKDLQGILYSIRGCIQFAILYDSKTGLDIITASIDHIVAEYGEKEIKHIEAVENKLIITV